MLRRDWVRYSAFALVAGWILVPQISAADPPSQYRKDWQAQRDAGEQDQNASPIESFHPNWIDWLSAKLGVTGCGPYAVDRLGRALQKTEVEYNSACDLDAQESVANSTRWLLILSLAQTVLGAFGAYLVWRTLRYNRIATEAALDAVRVSRDIGEKQTRAYLGIREVSFSLDAEHEFPRLGIKLQNTGQSPARDVEVTVKMNCTYHGGLILDQWSCPGFADIGSGEKSDDDPVGLGDLKLPRDLLGENFEKLVNVRLDLVAFATDVFDQEITAFGQCHLNWKANESWLGSRVMRDTTWIMRPIFKAAALKEHRPHAMKRPVKADAGKQAN